MQGFVVAVVVGIPRWHARVRGSNQSWSFDRFDLHLSSSVRMRHVGPLNPYKRSGIHHSVARWLVKPSCLLPPTPAFETAQTLAPMLTIDAAVP
jgi:hypothetical protein